MEPDTDQTRKFPAAAGGDHRVQLAHLKAHLKFQKQDRCDRAKISWNTIITRAQSRLHITLELNEKINSKTPGFHRPGKVNTPDGQRKLRSFASHARTGIFHGGDGNVRLPWRLRYRMYRARKPQLSDHAFREIEDERPQPRIPRKEQEFPLELRHKLALRQETCRLIQLQGANPKHHKEAVILTVHPCRIAGRNVLETETDEKGFCLYCGSPMTQFNLKETAYDPGEEPVYIEQGSWRRTLRQELMTHPGSKPKAIHASAAGATARSYTIPTHRPPPPRPGSRRMPRTTMPPTPTTGTRSEGKPTSKTSGSPSSTKQQSSSSGPTNPYLRWEQGPGTGATSSRRREWT